MKKVFGSTGEVSHIWAQQNQEEGRGGNVSFYKDKIYSYGRHFCMARILPSGTVVFGTHSYSSSTGTHQSRARGAVSHRRIVFCHDPDEGASYNHGEAAAQIKDHLDAAETKRKVLPKTRIESRLHALCAAERFNGYLKALPEDEQTVQPFDLTVLEISAEARLELQEYEREQEVRREQRWAQRSEERKRDVAKAALSESAKIAEWRAHAYNHSLHYVPTMLRVSKDGQNIETSRGANIPVSHAKRLWPLIENVRAVGKPLEDRGFRLGHYTLTRIDADGAITVGCHEIAFSEVEKMAKALGLLEMAA